MKLFSNSIAFRIKVNPFSHLCSMHVIKHILLLVSSGLLLLHSLIPHQHETCSYNCSQVQCDLDQDIDSPFTFLLHINLGENHLEDFNTASFAYVFPPCFAQFARISPVPFKQHFTPKESKIYVEIDFQSLLPSRAPPALS